MNAVSIMTKTAFDNYNSAMNPEPVKPNPTRGLLRIAGKQEPTAKTDFEYGQSIYIVEDLHVSELLVIGYSADKVYVRRLNGVRTSVDRNDVMWLNEEAACSALERKRKNLLDANNSNMV